ncbi:MAG: NAD(P)/FAD-dependent oxidoreductase [Thermomicrobiales bacterium]
MARSTAMRAVLAMARRAAMADAQIQGTDTPRVSRRVVLAGAGATAGLALFGGVERRSARAQATPVPGTPRVGIVGAGIGGLSAALALHDAGIPSTIFEASDRIGGRMHSNTTTWADDQTSEWCAELIDTGHTVIQELAARFDLPLVDLLEAMDPEAEDTYFFNGHYYTEDEANRDFLPVYRIAVEQAATFGPETRYDVYTPEAYLFDHMSIAQWIDQFVPGGLGSPLGKLLDAAYTTENGRDTSEQSALALIIPLADQPDPDNPEVLGASDERYHIEGGNQRLPEAIAAYVASTSPACEVRTNWRLTAVTQQVDGVTLAFATEAGFREEHFDRVILAIPFSVLRTLSIVHAAFDPLKRQAISELSYGTNAKLQLQFDERFWRTTGPWPGVANGFVFTDLGFQTTWEVSRGQAGTAGIINLFTGGVIGAGFMPDGPFTTSLDSPLTAAFAEQFLALLEEVLPGATEHYTGTATLSYPAGDPNLLGSYPTYTVGQVTTFGGYEAVPQGRIHFAGDACTLGLTGFMEGAARAGARAAQEVASVLNEPEDESA